MPHSLNSAADLDSKVSWRGAAAQSDVQLGKGHLKDLRSAGHKIDRYLAARPACARHLDKAGYDQMTLNLRGDRGEAPGDLAGDGLFSCAVLMQDHGFKFLQPVLPQDLTARFAELWQRTDADAPKSLPSSLPIPPDANAPLWLALLRLRPLHDLWERELRRGTFENLLDLLPDAWMLDPAPFPPGAVIPRLELASWSDLPRLSASGRRFLLTSPGTWTDGAALDATVPREKWASIVAEAAGNFANEPRVLIELPAQAQEPQTWLIAFFEKKAGRVDGIGAFALASAADGSLVPARVVAS